MGAKRTGDNLWQRKGIWLLDFRFMGKRYIRSLGKGLTRSQARTKSRALRAEIEKKAMEGRQPDGPSSDPMFDDVAAEFLTWAKTNTKPGTDYPKCIEALGQTFNGWRLSKIGPRDLEAYRESRMDAPTRCNREISCLRRMFNKAADLGLYDGPNPVKRIGRFKEFHRERILTPEEERRLLNECQPWLRPIVRVALHTGFRKTEVLTLRWEEVNLKAETIRVRGKTSKTGEPKETPMTPEVKHALTTIRLQTGNTKGRVFLNSKGENYRSFETTWKTARRKAGIEGLTFHDLRHTWASRLLEAGVDLRTIQELGGWSSLKQLERYIFITTDRKREAINKLSSSASEFRTGKVVALQRPL